MSPFFVPLTLARCDNREAVAHDRAEIAHLVAWLEAGNHAQGLHAVAFDFFVDWSSNRLQRVAWLKRASELRWAEVGPEAAEFETMRALQQDSAFNRLADFCHANTLDLSAMVFDDQQDWSSDVSWLVQAWPTRWASSPSIAAAALSLPALKMEIQRLSGGPINMGLKRLDYGTSRMECALSRSDAVWPGDVDLILADTTSNAPVAIVELKKHTGRSKIGFAAQKLANYYPGRDSPKYNRISLLASQLAFNHIPIVIVYYSTNPYEDYLILELVEGGFGHLKGTTSTNLAIQGRAPAALADALMRAITNMI